MTARSVFSLRTSAFNDFLYATVGDEDNGMVLTMLSVLARCGVDPWNEAARLNELPTEAATKRLTLMISGQPRGQWAEVGRGEYRVAPGRSLASEAVVGRDDYCGVRESSLSGPSPKA